jgi:hypothetical protein
MGLGDFVKGIGEGIGHAAGDVAGGIADTASNIGGAAVNVAKGTAFVATHLDDAAEAVKDYGAGAVKGVGWLASHPAYWDDAAKQMIVDQFTDPVNIATNVALLGLTVATGGAAAPGLVAKLGLGAKVGVETAEGIATAAKVADVAADTAKVGRTVERVASAAKAGEEAADIAKAADTAADVGRAGQTASRFQRFAEGTQQFGQRVENIVNKPTELARGIHARAAEFIPGMKQGELGYVSSARLNAAERFVGNTDEAGIVRRYIGGKIEGGAGKSSFTKAGSLGEAHYRASRAMGQARSLVDLRGNIKAFGDITQAVAHPEDAAQHLGEAAWHAYGDELTGMAIRHAPGLISKAFGGGDDEKPEKPDTYQPYQQADTTTQQTGLMQFRLDAAPRTRASRRQPGHAAALGTVDNSTMPSSIGPTNWYGPQGGYDAGRGFQQRSGASWGALPALEQPRPYDVLGV